MAVRTFVSIAREMATIRASSLPTAAKAMAILELEKEASYLVSSSKSQYELALASDAGAGVQPQESAAKPAGAVRK